MSVNKLVNDIVNQCKKHVKNNLAPIPIAESLAIIDSLNQALSSHVPVQNLEISATNVMNMVALRLDESDIKLRWSLDPTIIWDIR